MEVPTVGLDLAKHVFQIHAVDAAGTVIVRKALRRSQLLPFFAKLPPCLVFMEACGTSHHWARELLKLGHEVRSAARFTLLPTRTCCPLPSSISIRPVAPADRNAGAGRGLLSSGANRQTALRAIIVCIPPGKGFGHSLRGDLGT